ncbi:MAG: peptidylprolyl isomerase, partial [Maribacter sp.]|nr:peptidylprolyl isomerase [Maribacter sp.]
MYKTNKFTRLLLFLFISNIAISQVPEEVPNNQVEPVLPELQADMGVKKDSTPKFKKLKLDGIAAVVGDYVILESDIEKTLIDLKSQGAMTADITRCGLLGKLMEDRLYAHQAVQDSLLVSDDEVNL